MKAISTGNIYNIYDDTLKTYDKLPAQPYVVRFDPRAGFSLERYVDPEITEDKIYGVHNEKVEKVLSSFEKFKRSLGVILSGDKGIGKSLFAKMLSIEAIRREIPLIVVDTYAPGIASYIESIDQEVMVLFDEFDKTFGEIKSRDGEASPQTALLGLFDGMSGGKKLFVITCNSLHKLNEFLINRPGRFHYHFRFSYPSSEEIRQYMLDKLPEEMYGEIDAVVSFAAKVSLNYDCLRAITFELSNGLSFKDAIADLNIMNMNAEEYTIKVYYNNGTMSVERDQEIDMFGEKSYTTWLRACDGGYVCRVEFFPSDSIFDYHTGEHIIYGKDISILTKADGAEEEGEAAMDAFQAGIECIRIKRKAQRNMHYAV